MSAREQNRASMPKIAALVDSLRATFGDVRVLYANEGGKELGKVQSDETTALPDSATLLGARKAA